MIRHATRIQYKTRFRTNLLRATTSLGYQLTYNTECTTCGVRMVDQQQTLSVCANSSLVSCHRYSSAKATVLTDSSSQLYALGIFKHPCPQNQIIIITQGSEHLQRSAVAACVFAATEASTKDDRVPTDTTLQAPRITIAADPGANRVEITSVGADPLKTKAWSASTAMPVMRTTRCSNAA